MTFSKEMFDNNDMRHANILPWNCEICEMELFEIGAQNNVDKYFYTIKG